MSEHAYVAFGSNIEPEANLPRAMEALAQRVRISAVSEVYRTPAPNRPEDPDFTSGVVRVETALMPAELKGILDGIEAELGRIRHGDPHAAQTIDLDLLLFGDRRSADPDLTFPHRDLDCVFVAVPLLQISPNLKLPDGVLLTDFIREHFGVDPDPGQLDESLSLRLRRIVAPDLR